MLSCSASLPEAVVVPLIFNWRRWHYDHFQSEPAYADESEIDRTTNQSRLITNFTTPGVYHYECQVELYGNLQAAPRKESIFITVTGISIV